MKKYIVPTLFLVIAISLSFSKMNDTGSGPECDANLYWFKVYYQVSKSCNQITMSEVLGVPDYDNNGIPNEVYVGYATSAPYGCEDETSYSCAMGFIYSTDPAVNQLERVGFETVYIWRPKETALANYRCCVTRSASR